jgi:uncharacterized protein (DUF486 family)
MKKASVGVMALWLVLNAGVGILTDVAMFYQMTPAMEHASFWRKVLASEFWATLEWLILIPANRLGNTFLSAAQISLSSFIFDFLAQLWTNLYWLHLPTTPDDYVAMALIFGGMAVSSYKLLG